MAGTKRVAEFGYKVVLLDIEGTTTPISFVHDVLFPYIKTHLKQYVHENWESPQLQKWVHIVREQSLEDASAGDNAPQIQELTADCTDAELIKTVQSQFILNVLWQMKLDRKTTGLKALQGLMWREAYQRGEIKGVVYDDVLEALNAWRERNIRIFIYSSGSIAAQKLLFGFSDHGDLLHFFEGHFDTTTGPKVESSSYEAIANQVNVNPNEILFVTDNIKEAKAARLAGLHVAVSDRPGNAELSTSDREDFHVITTFKALLIDSVESKQKRSRTMTEPTTQADTSS